MNMQIMIIFVVNTYSDGQYQNSNLNKIEIRILIDEKLSSVKSCVKTTFGDICSISF